MKLKVLKIEIEGEAREVLGHIAGVLGLIDQEAESNQGTAEPGLAEPPLLVNPIPRILPSAGTKSAKSRRKSPAVPSVATIDWQKYPNRTARAELGPCQICQRRIVKSDTYYDGGVESRRAHRDCATEQKRTVAA